MNRNESELEAVLLNDEALLASETVTNGAMNRGRALTGVNSYERELRMDIGAFLARRVEERGQALWYDACCGEGRALREAIALWADQSWASRVQILGVDLWDGFVPVSASGSVRFVAADVTTFDPDTEADLVTCVHGIHYLGDKLAFLERCYACLAPGGVFVGHLDSDSLRFAPDPAVSTWANLLRRTRSGGAAAEYRKHVLRIEKNAATLRFGMLYAGASIAERPNFSGMIGIDSWYRVPDAAVGSGV